MENKLKFSDYEKYKLQQIADGLDMYISLCDDGHFYGWNKKHGKEPSILAHGFSAFMIDCLISNTEELKFSQIISPKDQ